MLRLYDCNGNSAVESMLVFFVSFQQRIQTSNEYAAKEKVGASNTGRWAVGPEMEAVLGVPSMRLPFFALAAWPQFLPDLWKTLKPEVDTGDYFQAAERLQADAYTRMFNYFSIPDLHAVLWRMAQAPMSLPNC